MRAHKQTTDGAGDKTGHAYNLSGAMVEHTYRSGRVVKNVLDASGDLSMVQSARCMDAAAGTGAECATHAGLWNYARHFNYNAAGAVTSMQLGNGRWESTAFNSRLQPTQIALGSTGTGAQAHDLLKLDYGYGTTNNNGNVLSQTITVKRPNQSDLVFDQLYTYDSLNRITSAEEKTGTTVNWNQTYTFDRYGNRNFNESLTTTLPKGCIDDNNPVVCEADRKMLNPHLNPANNKMASGQGWSYDAAGNVIGDPKGRSFIYDAENKQVEVENSLEESIGKYWFDGDGKRIKKEGIAPNGQPELTVFVYDAGGKLIGEYSTNVETAAPKVQYLTNDHLGSPRINTDQNGTVTSRTDYMPYGEEIIALGGRSSNEAYTPDDIRKGFTGYERDDETALEYAQARMYASALGRFNSSDPLISSARAEIPQSWNRYLYTLNSPAVFTDPDGKDIVILIWATEKGKVGHAGIAISNYKIERKTVNGKIVETKVPDGTYTYRDLWPGGRGAGKYNFDKDIPAEYQKKFAGSLGQLLDTDISESEGYSADGAIRLNTDWETDNKVHLELDKLQNDNPNYNGVTMNCTDFVERGVEAATGSNIDADEVVYTNVGSTGSISQDRLTGGRPIPTYSTTPNQLFTAVRGLSNATVIEDPGSKIDNPFTRSVVSGKIKRLLKP